MCSRVPFGVVLEEAEVAVVGHPHVALGVERELAAAVGVLPGAAGPRVPQCASGVPVRLELLDLRGLGVHDVDPAVRAVDREAAEVAGEPPTMPVPPGWPKSRIHVPLEVKTWTMRRSASAT